MRASAQVDRKDSFKKGLGGIEDAAERTNARQEGIRKKKRDDVIERRRKQGNVVTQGMEQESLMQQLTRNYSVEKFMANDAQSMNALHEICRIGNNAQLQILFPLVLFAGHIDKPVVIQRLVEFISVPGEHTGPALDTLVNITGASTSYAVVIAQVIINAKFLTHAVNHIKAASAGPWLNDIWAIIANLVCLCPEARDVILGNPAVFPEAFFLQVRAKTVDIATLLLVICGAVEVSAALPPQPFLMAAWPFIVLQLKAILPYPMQQTDYTDTNGAVDYLLSTFQSIAVRCNDESEEQMSFFGGLVNYNQMELIPFMVNLVPRVENVNKLRICQFLVKVGQLPQVEFQHCMLAAGAVNVMVRMVQDASERLRREGLIWLGNFASSGMVFVNALMDCKAYEPVIHIIRRQHKAFLVRSAIYVLIAVCNSCMNCAPSEASRAEDVMVYLFQNYKVIQLSISHVDVAGGEKLTIDILTLWRDAVKWNRSFVAPLLEECGAMDRVAKLVGHKHTTIFNLCSQIDELVNHQQHEEMDLASSSFFDGSTMTGIDASAPSVYHGGFLF